MKRSFFIAVFIFLGSIPVYAQDSEKQLDQIRAWFKEVNSKISQYKKVELPDITVNEGQNSDPYSMEGAEIYRLEKVNMTKYFEGDQLVKMVLEFYGDRENLTSEYYFKNGDLFFIDKVKTIFHRPKWDDEFNETERSVSKNRFYFNENRLIRWINPEINSVGKMDPSYKDHESKILNDYRVYVQVE